jgi:DNA topoisomerase-3
MTALWICEKPSAARDIARVLFGGVASHSSPVMVTKEGTRLVYTAGHALELAPPDFYDPAWKSWDKQNVGELVRGGFRMVPAGDKADMIAAILKEIKAASEIVVATDAGREGEVIAWEILDHAKSRLPVRRFWTASMTDAALAKAGAALLPGAEKLPLYHAGRARSRADWVEGLSYTRYFTRNHTPPKSKVLSVGRVQSAVTALIDDRCAEIAAFVSKTYFEIAADVSTAAGALRLVHRPPADRRVESKIEAEAISARIVGISAPLAVKTLPKSTKPVDFMSTSLAQKRAFTLWKWKPDFTLSILQRLYEAKLTTYPRTECSYLSREHAAHMPAMLKSLVVLPEVAAVARQNPEWFEAPVIRPGSYVDDAQLTDHHAIIPTENVPDVAALGSDEAALYQLIVRHTVANLLPDYRYDSTSITADLDGRPFKATGRTVRDLGWRKLISDDQSDKETKRARKQKPGGADLEEEEEAANLPPVSDGDSGSVTAASAITKTTKPPAYFNLASLLDAMVNIDLYIDDPRGKAILGGSSADQKRGIGTGATRANIIKTVFDREYVEEKGSAIHTTARGKAFVSLARRLVPWMVNPIHSVDQEEALMAIESGKAGEVAYVASTLDRTHETVLKLAATGDKTMIGEALPPAASYPCPACGAAMARRKTKDDKFFWACTAYKKDDPASCKKTLPDADGKPGERAAPQDAPAGERIYFAVSFDDKDKAKAAGLRWDGDKKKWFAPDAETAAAAVKKKLKKA